MFKIGDSSLKLVRHFSRVSLKEFLNHLVNMMKVVGFH